MKKFITASLAILLLASLAIVGISASALPGDVNGDAEVNIRDAASILLYVNGKPVECVNDVIDTNGDGVIDQNDAQTLLESITGHEDVVLNTGDACEHELSFVEGYVGTCPESGLVEHWVCTKCSKIFKDKDAVVLSNTAGVTLEPKHIPGEWSVETPAGKTENGLKVLRCQNCPAVIDTDVIPYRGSEGLEYTLNPDGISYSVSKIGTCTDTEVVIPAVHEGLPVTSIGDVAFDGYSKLAYINLPDSITSIGASAFRNCSALSKIIIPDSVTSIGNWAFYGCSSLESINIPDGVTSIGSSALRNCSKLTSINLPDSVTNIGAYAFGGCSALTNINIPNGVTNIGDYAFFACSSLTSITIPSGIKFIRDYTFHNCSSLAIVTLPDSVTNIGSCAFQNCSSLTSIILPNRITNIQSSAFFGCSNLTSINIPNSVISIGASAFRDCSALPKIIIPESVTSIGNLAFYNCKNLVQFIFDGFEADWAKVIKGNEWNINCPFTEVVFTKFKTSEGFTFALNDDGKSYTLRRIGTCTDTELVLPSEYNGLPVTAIASWAFSENDSIVSVIIPDSVTDIGSGAFYHCSSLKKVVLSKNLKVLNNILSYCESLTEIELPEGITELNNTFNSSPIKSINFPSTLTKIEGAFFATALEKVEIPASVTVIGKSSFQCCNELTEVIIKGKTSIGEEAFDNCPKLSKVTMNAVTSIGAYAFSECASLERIVLPDSVTSLGENIFDECPALVDCFFDGNANQWFAVDRNETWFNPQTVEGYYIHGGRMWEDTNVILLKPEYSFTLNENNSSYTWNGSGGFRNIIFSSTYNGLPVTNFKLVDPYGQYIKKVYFDGTPAEWDAITMSGDTYIIERTVVYYYSFKEPTTCGNFWHYVDGLPVAWGEEGREHTVVTTPAVPATCTENGLTEGKTCSVCGFVIAYQNTVYSKGHQKVSENGKAATARTFGYTKYEYCTVCLTVTSERELILPTGISDPANYTGKYGYEYLATLEKGEAMQQFYKSLDHEAAKFHLNGETLNNQYNTLPFISYTDLGLSYDEAISVYIIYKSDHPLYYWISNTWYYSSGKLAMSVVPEYVDGETRTKTNEFVYAALAEYLKIVMNETSDYQIAFGLHDAIVLNASYAYESNGKTPEDADWAHSIIGILDRNLGVCESYAELFHTLLNFAGVDSILVHGLGNGGAHAWNLVRLDDGEWYWYDPTWAETTWEYYGVNHTAFCLTDTQDPTVDIAGWEFSRSPFAESHVPYSSENYGRYYCYALPERSETAFDTDDTQLYDTFIYEGTKYIVIGYGRVFCSEIWGINSTPPETLTYNGREYKVVVYEY